MAKQETVNTSTKKQPKLGNLKKWAMPKLDWLMTKLAGVFFIFASYGFVANWLKENQNQHDLSIVGGIITVSIALYLFFRKR